MQTATQTFEAIQSHGAENSNDSTLVVTAELLGQADYIPQGDINIWPLEKMPPRVKATHPDCQLAPGTTRGSRHCIAAANMGKVEFFKLSDPNPLQGPILRFSDAVRIEHPEHGDIVFPPGIYFVSYQRRHADEIKRIQD